MNRILAMLLLLVLMASSVPTAFAAEASYDMEAHIKAIESKYGIRITYESDKTGVAAADQGSLDILDGALANVTAPVVKQVSTYYRDKLGRRLTYTFVYTPYHTLDSNVEILASFNTETAVIEVYIPSNSKGTFISGCSPITVLHEFAHAYHMMYMDLYGAEKMEREWTKLNRGTKYNTGYLAYLYNKLTFISSYGATSFEEDFAEVFSQSFARTNTGQGFYHKLISKEKHTALGDKVSYIEQMLPRFLEDTDQAVENLHRIFTTKITLNYGGVRLSDEYMQYIGYEGPRHVLEGITEISNITVIKSEWIKKIGGWHIKDNKGDEHFVFPGGMVKTLSSPLRQAS